MVVYDNIILMGDEMNGVLFALLGTLFTFGITSLGALNVFVVKNNVSNNMQSIFLGFAGGVMVAASMWSLLIPAIDAAQGNGQISWLVVPGGFLLGVVLLLIIDMYMKKKYNSSTDIKPMSVGKRTSMLILAITIHNIPEGMAVGLAFAMAAQNMDNPALMSGAIALAVGIGIQNYPEGAAVSLPLLGEGFGKKKAFFIGSMSAIVEPVAGVLAATLAMFIRPYMPLLLALAAGTMIYVVVEELIPEAHMGDKDNVGTLGFVVGFMLMMILDVALG